MSTFAIVVDLGLLKLFVAEVEVFQEGHENVKEAFRLFEGQ